MAAPCGLRPKTPGFRGLRDANGRGRVLRVGNPRGARPGPARPGPPRPPQTAAPDPPGTAALRPAEFPGPAYAAARP